MDLSFLSPSLLWAMLGIIFLVIEFILPGFVFFFFGLGAFLAAVLCLLMPQLSLDLQLLVFIAGSLFSLIALRRWVKNVFSGFFDSSHSMPLNKQSYVGETAVVVKTIEPDVNGKVEFHGSLWPATADEKLEQGETVRIVEQNNITFTVEKVQPNNQET
ncbi:MAG: NfeD family protein [Lentisphaeria bacterium]